MDNIKDKLRKIKNLVDEGVDGEALAAKYQLEKLLIKYNLKFEDLFDVTLRERRFKVPKNEVSLFFQVLTSIIGVRGRELFHYTNKPSIKIINLTDEEYIDIDQQFNFHKKQLKKELNKVEKQIFIAYIHKHNLYNCDKDDSTNESKNEMSLEEYMEILIFVDKLENVSFRKQLTK